MTLLGLIRHGPTAWNREQRNQGRSDIPLDAEGRDAVARWRLPAELAGARMIASPLVRAVETATLLAGRPPVIEPRLIEMDWGAWEGRTTADLRATLGDAMQTNEDRGLDFRPSGGESPRDVQNRLKPWLAEIAARGEPAVAVAHNGVIRAVTALAWNWNMLGKPPVKLRRAVAHLFDLDAAGHPSVRALNVPLEPPP